MGWKEPVSLQESRVPSRMPIPELSLSEKYISVYSALGLLQPLVLAELVQTPRDSVR